MERFPNTWAKQLSLAEFATNNAKNKSTGFTPFFLNSSEDPTVRATLISGGSLGTNQVVTEAIDRLKEALRDAKTNLTTVKQRMK